MAARHPREARPLRAVALCLPVVAAMAVAAVAAAPALAGGAYAQMGGGPAIVGISSPDDDGVYGTGKIVVVSIEFSGAVDVAGAPTLALATDPPRHATYAGGSGSTDLEFWYTVRPGDDAARLDYAGTGALMLNGGSITGSDGGMAADTMLPEPGSSGSLGASKSIAVVGGPLPILRAADSAVHGEENYRLLAGVRSIDTLEAVDDGGGGAHALVAAPGAVVDGEFTEYGLQLVRVHPNGTLSAGGSIVANINHPLAYLQSVTAFEMGDRGRALASAGNDGRGYVSLVDMYPNGTIMLNSSAGDGGRGFVELEGAAGASVFRVDDGQFHALVSAQFDDGLQLLRILPNGTLVPSGSAANEIDGLELSAPLDVDMLGADGRGAGNRGPPRAIVSTNDPGGLQLVSVLLPDGTISHNGSAMDGEGEFETLRDANGVAAFEMGGLDYAVASSFSDHGLQLVRILPNGTLAAADSATNGAGGFDALDQPWDVDVFSMGGLPYALVASFSDDGLQLVRIHRDGTLAAAGSATDGTGGFVLGGASAVDVFHMGDRAYAMAGARGDNAVQLVRLFPASVANVSLSADGSSGPYTEGFMINITVAFDEPVVLQDPQRPTSILLSFDGAADNNDMTAAPYLDGNGTNKLVFNYTVRPGDSATPVLEYAHAGALASRGAITDMRGDPVDLELPEPGTDGSIGAQGVRIVARSPSVVYVSSPTYDGSYGPGAAIWIDVTFDEPVYVEGGAGPTLEMNVPSATATYHSGSGTDTLRLLYTVEDGHNTPLLAYAGASALAAAGGATVRNGFGNDADLALDEPGQPGSLSESSSIAIDTDTPACPSADDRCVYHVTRSLAVGDIVTHAVRIHPDTGYVYTASQPYAGSRDINHSYVRIYSSADEGHELIREIRFNGTNSRVPEIEINAVTDELHVINMWGVGDRDHGWAGIDTFANGDPTHWDGTLADLSRICNSGGNTPPACFDGRGKVNLTTISLDTHTVTATVQLEHDETDGNGRGPTTTVQRYTHLGADYDLVLDTARDIAYVSDRNAPILAVDTLDTTLMRALVDHSAELGGGPGSAWNGYLEGASATAMAVDEATGTVYAAVRTGLAHDRNNQAWGIAALSFLDDNGAFTPHYTRTSLVETQSNPPEPRHSCRHADFNDFECGRHVRSYSMQLDAADSKLFVLFANHTVWAYELGESGEVSAVAPPEEVHVRTPAETGRIGDRPVLDIALDGERRLLYASLFDYTDPRVVSINADDHTRVGVSSGTSQLGGMGIDRQTGALYVLPFWAPHAYVIEAELRPDLQEMIDDAEPYSTVVVPAGTHDDTVLDIAKPLTLVSDPPGAAKFTGYSRIEVESDDVTIRGLAFEDTDCLPGFGGSLVEIRAHHGTKRDNVTIENNAFRDTCHAAIQKEGTGGLSNINIRGNTLEGIGLKLPDGWTEPIDTGGENEFQVMHAAIGLAHHPGQGTVGGSISDNRIVGTSAAGIRVFKADGLVISGNHIEDTPASGIGLAHSPMNVLVANNTIVDANNEPDLDYLAGINGSGEPDYYKTIHPRVNYLTMSVLDAPYHTPASDAAISVWSNGMNITATGNTIRESDGAFAVCANVCAFESDGIVRAGNRNIPADKDIEGAGYSFTGNTVHWHFGPDNNGVLVRSGAANGALNATGNYFAGLGAMPDAATIANGTVDLGEMLLPSVASVSTELEGGAYGPGTPVYIDVEFTDAVHVRGGPPTLALATTPPRDAVYDSGTGSATLTFLYTVQDGDAAANLNYRDADALALNDGTIKDAGGRDAGLGLPGTDSDLSLGGGSVSIVPATSPAVRVQGVSSTNPEGTYTGGSVIEIEVAFNAAVSVAGGDGGAAAPALALDLDPLRYATYDGGSGTDTLTFLYTVQPGDGSEALEYEDRAALIPNGSIISSASDGTIAAVLTLPVEGSADSLAASNIRVSGAHAVAEEPPLRLLEARSDTPAAIAIDPHGRLLAPTVDGRVLAYDPDGTNALDTRLGGRLAHIASDPSGRIIVANETTVSVLYRNGTVALEIPGLADVFGVASDPSGRIIVGEDGLFSELYRGRIHVYHPNGTLNATLHTEYSKSQFTDYGSVAYDPSGRILASDGSRDRIEVFHPNGTHADTIHNERFAGGAGLQAIPNALSYDPSGRLLVAVFNRAASSDDVHALHPNGSSVEFRIPYPHAFITDIASDPSGRILVAGRQGVVDVFRLEVPLAPAVEDVSARSHDGSLAAGESVTIDVLFDSDVSVNTTGGSPVLLLKTGTLGRHAAYEESSGRTVSFTYTVEQGDESPDLGYAWAGALDPRGAAIADAESGLLTASTALPPPGAPGSLSHNEDIVVDTAAPAAVSASSPNATGAYKAGDRIAVEVRFDEAVVVASGRPQLALATVTQPAGYHSGSGSDRLTFVYTVQAGDTVANLNYAGAGALDLSGGSITDAAGNDATLTLPEPNNYGLIGPSMPIKLDTTAPHAVSASSSNMTGTYRINERIAINVTFSEPVIVKGMPLLAMDTGDTDQLALYTAGNNSRMLLFLYTVQPGAVSANLDYNGTDALALNGGSITDTAGNDAILMLPPPGTDGLRADDDPIEVNTMVARVLRVDSDTADGAYMAGEVIAVKVVFSEAVTVAGAPVLAMETGDTDRRAVYDSASSTATDLVFLYTVQDGDNSVDLDYANDTALTLGGTGGGAIQFGMPGIAAALGLPDPGSPGSLAHSRNIAVDTIDPRALSASPISAAGAYRAGERIAINVSFSEPVIVEGVPTMELGLDGENGQASYDSGNGSAMLTFVYAVVDGDNTAAGLDYNATNAIDLDGGSIADYAGNDATLALPPPGDPGSLAHSRNIAVDTIDPRMVSTSQLNASDAYMAGERIAINVTFDEPVFVAGGPPHIRLVLEGGATGRAHYVSGDDSTMLTFVYTVEAGHNIARMNYLGANAMNLNAGTIKDAAGNDANPLLPFHEYRGGLILPSMPGGPLMPIRIDTTAPEVSSVSPLNDTGMHTVDAKIAVNVTFTEPVVVKGEPLLAMETGDTDQPARFVAGNGSSMLTFVYTVQDGDNSDDLDYANDTALTLGSGNGGAIRDKAGNDANRMLPDPGNDGLLPDGAGRIRIDTAGATIVRVTSDTRNGTYMAGAEIDVKVVFNEDVVVTGAPVLAMETGSTDRPARYNQARSTDTDLVFLYTVQDGDNSDDLDYANDTALALNGGTIKDTSNNDAVLMLPDPGSPGSLADSKDIAVDTIDPRIDSVSPLNASDAYMAEARIAINVTFSEPVVVTGTPFLELGLDGNGAAGRALYNSGNGSAMLTFVYMVQDNDNAANLDYTGTSALMLNGGTITDTAGNDAVLTTLPEPGNDGLIGPSMPIKIDTTKPTVESVSSLNGTDTYGIGKRIAVNITFSEPVVVAGVPTLAMETGDTDRQALYVAGSNTSALTFVYQVRPGDNATDLDYNGTGALALAGGSAIRDTAGNSANRTLPEPGNDGLLAGAGNPIAIDGEGAGVLRVTSDTDDGAYMKDEVIYIKVVFNENVFVGSTGSPTLALDTGGAGQQAEYVSGSSSDTLTFMYTVQEGDNSDDLNYASENALALGGSTIQDAGGNNATRILPSLNSANSLAGLKDIVVDTIDPRALSALPLNASDAYMAEERIAINVTFSEPVVVTGEPFLELGLDGNGATARAGYDSGNGSRMLTFVYAVGDNDNAANLDYTSTSALMLNGGTITDAAGNDAVLTTLPDPGNDGLLGPSMPPIKIDTTDPTVSTVSSLNGTDTYGIGKRIAVSVAFNETVLVDGIPVLYMETGDTDRPAWYVAGNDSETLTFVYQVRPGDNATDLDYNGTDALALAGGSTIRDTAGNSANLTLPEPGNDGLLVGAGNPIAIDGDGAGVLRVTSDTADGAYMKDEVIDIKVVFSESVTLGGTGSPTLALETGDTDRLARYDRGNDSDTLTFLYTVQTGDNSVDLDYANDTALALNGSTIKDTIDNNAILILPSPGDLRRSLAGLKDIAVDTIDPKAVSVSPLNDTGAYMAEERIAINVTFSEPVVVTGEPFLELGLDGNGATARAGYNSGNGSAMLTFVYTVQDNDNAANLDYTGTNALMLNGGTITDNAGNGAVLTTLPDPAGDGLIGPLMPIVIDTTKPAVLTVSSLNGTGTYGIGKRIAVSVAFDETVLVGGHPLLALETGDTDRQALYVAGNDSETLTFVYQVRPGDNATDLDYNGTAALTLGGGFIRDTAGNDANLTLSTPGDDGLLAGAGNPIAIDGTGAGVLRVTSDTDDGAYMKDEVIDIKVMFSENVFVGSTGSPTLALDTGGAGQQAEYVSGSSSDTLTFMYTVREGDNSDDLNYASVNALALGGSTIQDAGGNDATRILPSLDSANSLAGLKDIVVDTIDPRALPASSPNATGTYGAGARIAINVDFTEAVLVEGAPVLAMETGATDRQAPYAEGNNSETLTFVYTVQDGDNSNDLDYASASALALGAGAIRDAAGNNANLTLPEPGSDGLLAGADSRIRIDTAQPARENATVLSAVFTARNTATITYSGSLGMPEGREGARVYENVSIVGGYTVGIAPENVTGLGSATHRIAFGGDGVDSSQAGTVSLASELVGTSSGGTLLRFADTTIPVERGETVRIVEQHEPRPPDAPPPPTVAIERDGFTRAVNATGAGNGTRVAINVTGLAPPSPPPQPGAPQPANATTAEFPAEPVTMIAAFAEVTFPANATASSVPAGGLIVLYASDDVPPEGDIAAALGLADAGSLRVRQVVEIGSNEMHIAFDAPVRILLVGQAGGAGAFYVNTTDGAVVPINAQCSADRIEATAAQLAGAGECWIDVPGAGKVIYTYHLTRFGTAAEAEAPPADAPEPASVSVLQRPGGEPLRAPTSYVEGQSIIIAVDFSAPVSVDTTGGTPRLLLETGSAGAAAPYASGSGTDRLEFEYAVRGGDITGRLSYSGTAALELGSGAITAAAAGTAASLALPPPGETGSLSAPGSPAVRIDPIGRPVLAVGILDEGGAGAGHVSMAAYMASAEFNERQGRTDGALLINATSYDAGGGTADAAAAADALRSAHSSAGGAGPSVYIGPSTDRGLHAAMPYAAANNIVLVSAGSTAPSLAVAGDRTFRLLPSDRLEAEALARLAYSGGDELVHAVLDNATYGPQYGSGARGGLADADVPPSQGAFAHAFGAALASAAISPLSGTVTLAGGGADGAPYEGAAAAAALDASVQAASASGTRPASVVYLGSPEGLAALADSSASYPALSSASWFASGLSAGSDLLAGDGSAAGFAASSGLSAARWSPPASAAGQSIDSMLPGLGPGERNSAYAAYDAVIVVGEAAVAALAAAGGVDAPGAAAIADALPAAAAAYDGALGDIALDYAGDLWVPAVYDLWTVSRQGGGAGTTAEWSRQQGELDGERACSITLTRARIDYGPIDSGQTSRPHLQTIVNTGQLPFAQVDLTTTPWHVDSPGNCEPGVEPSLPVGLSEVRTVQGGAFSDLTGSGTVLAQGLEAGSRAPLWYRLSLAGYADLPQAEITQCATYVVRCS